MRDRLLRIGDAALIAAIPIVLALVANGILLAALGHNPFTFYGDMFERGLIDWDGFQESIIRSAPLLLIAAGLIVAFRANLWNLGIDGQFLLGASLTAGFAPSLLDSLGVWPMLLATMAIAVIAGGAWTIVPAVLRGRYGVNEIVTTLMMSFIGIGVANVLVKGPFETDVLGVARTDVIPFDERFPLLGDTRIHLGFVIAVAAILAVHVLMTRTSLGLRLRVLGANPRAALHAGLRPAWLTVIAFTISGALIGLSGAVEILGVQGAFRADFNPAYGLLVIPLVFLARLNAIGSLVLVIAFAVIQIGGESAARQAEITSDVLFLIVGLILVFMAAMEYLRTRRGLGLRFVPPEVAERLRPAPGAEPAPGESRPAIGAGEIGSR
jgi:ABC-type uncharacterized transport system permease subunit